jgi:hypothetical protein
MLVRKHSDESFAIFGIYNIDAMKRVCLQMIKSGGYTRIAENCKTPNNLGLIIERKRDGDFWLWVKKVPSASGAKLYSHKDCSSFRPHKNNPDSTPRGGTGYLGGRKFSDLAGVKAYLRNFASVVTC